MLTLAFDTSAAHCAAALLSGDRIVATRHEDMAKGQAERLMPLLEELLAETGAAWQDLARIGVGTGPGNFTGIRISVSAARGLALSLGIPALGVSMLEAQAYGMPGAVLSCLDARQDRAFIQLFQAGKPGSPALTDLSFSNIMSADMREECIATGSFSNKVGKILEIEVVENPFSPIEAIARIAAARNADGKPPAPLYLRPADAAPPKDSAPVILT